MRSSALSPRIGRVLAILAALLLSTAALLTFAAPASAHDELLSTDPAADASVADLPAQLTLTFSGDLLADAGATEVQVTDAAGTSLVAGAPVVEANVVTQPLTPGATGAIGVIWRAVSSDGHPISGEYSFTVTAPATPTPTPTPTATRTVAPTASPSPSEASSSPTPTAAPVESDGGSSPLPWILLAVVGVAVLGGVVYLLASRARRARELEEARTAGRAAPAENPSPGPSEPGSDAPSER